MRSLILLVGNICYFLTFVLFLLDRLNQEDYTLRGEVLEGYFKQITLTFNP